MFVKIYMYSVNMYKYINEVSNLEFYKTYSFLIQVEFVFQVFSLIQIGQGADLPDS
jgi:hypothetical protein